MDWNVFFSTISQTSGAIVGIFAAFLITKIIANQSDFAKLKNEATHHLIESESIKSEADSRYFNWYNERVREAVIDKIDDDFWENEELLSLDDYIKTYNFSPFDDSETVKLAVANKITELTNEIEKKKQFEEDKLSNAIRFGAIFDSPYPRKMSSLMTPELRRSMNEEREMIDQLVIKAERQTKRNHVLNIELNDGADSVNLVSCSIFAVLILFFAGVIYPLSFLPWDPQKELTLSLSAFWTILFSLQGFMLALLSVIFSTLMVVFFIINFRLKHSSEMIEKIMHYSEIANYSPFFSNYVKNKN
ncbi:hypothetical protein [Aeromonas diversa]|uniref:hypothetical protein n=1 Tax=Aeromonas diversa TaxID=502790 RepID=UPI003461AA95